MMTTNNFILILDAALSLGQYKIDSSNLEEVQVSTENSFNSNK